MAIDRRLETETPADTSQGLGADLAQPLEGMSDPTITTEDDGSHTVDFSAPEDDLEPGEEGFNDNLAEYLKDDELQSIGRKVCEWVDQDDRSRTDWKKTYTDGLELLGLKIEERSDPWM